MNCWDQRSKTIADCGLRIADWRRTNSFLIRNPQSAIRNFVPVAILCISPALAQMPPVTFADVSQLLEFEHVSFSVGGSGLAGAAWFDFDNDGNLDLFLPNGKNQKNALFHNDGDGIFT